MSADAKPPTIDPGRLKHLEMIQAVITRMAANSFLIKGWSLTLLAALLTLAIKEDARNLLWAALIPILGFWSLDGFFLRQERLYRKLWDKIRKETPQTEPTNFDMNASVYAKDVASPLGVIMSRTLLGFHGALLAVVLALLWRPGFFFAKLAG